MDSLASVANKGLTERLNPLDATYKKHGEGSRLWLTRHPLKDSGPLSASADPVGTIGSEDQTVPTMSGHESRVTSRRVAPLRSECYDLVFYDPY